MTYRQTFDRLGNPVGTDDKPGLQHRIIRWAAVITIAASLAIMLWGR